MLISKEMLVEVTPRWDRIMRDMNADAGASAALGWIMDMFAYTLALVNTPTGIPEVLLNSCLMAQPPFQINVTLDSVSPSVATKT